MFRIIAREVVINFKLGTIGCEDNNKMLDFCAKLSQKPNIFDLK